MALGLPVTFVLLAQAVAASPPYGPPAPAPDRKPAAAAAGVTDQGCADAQANGDQRVIVVCAQRPNGYRLNPDVMEAKRELHSGGPPPPRWGRGRPNCATIGPAGCMNTGINLIAAAITAAEMAKRLAEGKEIGSMFITDPHPDEYQLYRMAKARREAEEAEKAAAAKAKAAAQASPAPAAAASP